MNVRTRNVGARVGRSISRGALVFGAAGLGFLSFRLPGVSGFEALMLAAIIPVAAVAGVVWQSHALTRERWQAAWKAYLEQESSREAIGPIPGQDTFPLHSRTQQLQGRTEHSWGWN